MCIILYNIIVTCYNNNLAHNILQLDKLLVQLSFVICKTELDILYIKLCIRDVSRVAERLKT